MTKVPNLPLANLHKMVCLTRFTFPKKPHSASPYKNASEESKVYSKLEKYEIFRKQKSFGAVHTCVLIDAKNDYIISRELLEMDSH